MMITDPFVLPADVVLMPVADLPLGVRQQFEWAEGDYAITRPRSRAPSKIINSEVAELLGQFHTPKTIVEAVISYSEEKQIDPKQILDNAYPVLQRFIDSRTLVPIGTQHADPIVPSFDPYARVGAFEVLRCVQVLEDTELYKVKTEEGETAALKISRPGHNQEMKRAFAWEANILNCLDGHVNPKLLAAGTWEDRDYLAIEWHEGVPVTVAATELRRELGGGRQQVHRLCHAILEAYAHLHAQKVIHSDVHPRNVLVDRSGAVKLIDFGLARIEGTGAEVFEPNRGGIGFFFEPEFAIARLRHRPAPKSNFLGEQYALAALLYFLITGTHYLAFSAEKKEMRRQIAEDEPLAFRAPVEPWPEAEALLRKALSKTPSARFSSVAEFSDQWDNIDPADAQKHALAAANGIPLLNRSAADAFLDDVLRGLQMSGSLFLSGITTPPTSSINYGASGIAYFLYRLSCIRADPRLLSLADIWSTRSVRDMTSAAAFYNSAIEISPETVGEIALYHTASGVYAVQALISHAMGDMVSPQQAIDAFVAAAAMPCDNLDLTLGRSSTLVGCSLLLDATAGADFVNNEALRQLGDATLRGLWDQLNHMPPIREETTIKFMGIAHGWAGFLYATLLWCQTANRNLPPGCETRLQQLAECGQPAGRGLRWPIKLSSHRSHRPDNYMSGWCNGSAGYIFLWTLAHAVFHDESYLRLAARAAWNAWEQAIAYDSLCCGSAGAAYGLLNLYRHTADTAWLQRAQALAEQAIAATKSSELPHSLYKGTMGVALLIADLGTPDAACMPLFEREGWPISQ